MPVKVGYKNIWGYHGRWTETKIKKGLWKFRFVATKNKRASRYGPIGFGDQIHWGFRRVNQKVRKTGKGKYQTVLTGLKFYKGGDFY